MTAPDNKSDKTKNPWRTWAMIFVPAMAVTLVALNIYGFSAVMPFLVAVLVLVLLYQRFVKKRSWQSIIWGDNAKRK